MLRRIECDRYTSASDLRCDGVKQRGIQNGAGRSVNHGDVGSAGVSGELGAAGMIDIERKDGRRRVSGVSQSGTSGVQPRKEEARGLRGYGAADSRKIWELVLPATYTELEASTAISEGTSEPEPPMSVEKTSVPSEANLATNASPPAAT